MSRRYNRSEPTGRFRLAKLILIVSILAVSPGLESQAQPGPWNNPLMMAWSSDGQFFSPATIFQDSSGVPSAIRWKGDTLVCVFQWFRQPIGSPTWDRVAVKFSYDNGAQWTTPTPIVINGIPTDYQRPFDPTLAVLSSDSLRMYFSSSRGMPPQMLDSSINTYSAISADGIHYRFEPGPRVDHPTRRVIDPAVISFNGSWHFSSPIGAPQEGAYHYTSADGLTFVPHANYPSDNTHNWTGNFLVQNSSQLRFYGSGPRIWYNTSPDGFTWVGYVNTNMTGGDPTVVKLASTNYLLLYVGPPYTTDFNGGKNVSQAAFALYQNYPNPFNSATTIRYELPALTHVTVKVIDLLGREVATLVDRLQHGGNHSVSFDAAGLASGVYVCRLSAGAFIHTRKLLLLR